MLPDGFTFEAMAGSYGVAIVLVDRREGKRSALRCSVAGQTPRSSAVRSVALHLASIAWMLDADARRAAALGRA